MKILSDKNNNNSCLNISEDILKEIALTKSEQLVKSLVEEASSAIAFLDNQLRYITVSKPWLKEYNLSLSEVTNTSYPEIFDRQFSTNEESVNKDYLVKETTHHTEQKIIDRDGIIRQLKLSIYPWRNECDEMSGLIVFSTLLDSELSVEPFFDLSLDMLCITGLDGYLKKVNPSFTKVLGYSSSELIEQPFLSFVHPDDIEATLAEMKKLEQGIACVGFENRYCCQDGSYLRLQWMAAPPQKGQNIIYAIARNVTKSYELKEKLSWQLRHDPLTGLLNRQEFEQKITKIIATTKITQEEYAFCYLDLDRFKVINEICGHLAGDLLLKQITNLIESETRKTDTLCRLEGDKFGLLLKDCSLKTAEIVANDLREVIKNFSFNWQEKNFAIGVSIGVVSINTESQDFSTILNNADLACNAAKKQGRNWVRVYHPEDRDLLQQKCERHWVSKLNLALKENHFCLYCQKITPLQESVGTDHYEILLRLFDKEGNLIPPMAFIPAAERYDLMPAIDRWVISTFFASYQDRCRLLNTAKLGETIYTINLSGASINSEQFFTFLKQQFATHEIAPEKICFEITETAAIANLTKAARFIRELKELGCSFALDDFGSGMSSLNYLKNLPVDYLKIDGNFVKNIVNDPIDRATVECFNRIGEVMNIQTIAEFVENDAIIAQLKEIGVNYAQGYGIDKPSPLYFSNN